MMYRLVRSMCTWLLIGSILGCNQSSPESTSPESNNTVSTQPRGVNSNDESERSDRLPNTTTQDEPSQSIITAGDNAATRHTESERAAPGSSSTKQSDESPADTNLFADRTKHSGIDFTYQNGRRADRFLFPEALGGGVGILDFDLDGWSDLAFAGGGTIDQEQKPDTTPLHGLSLGLFHNRGNLQFVDRTHQARTDQADGYTHGCTVGDWDRDGFPDLLITGFDTLQFWRNQGDGTFEIQSIPDLPRGWFTSAVFADVDQDGQLDLFVLRYCDWTPSNDRPCIVAGRRELCGPGQYGATQSLLLINLGNGHFEDQSQSWGLLPTGKGLGLVAFDFNQDGRVDFYVANDEMPNHLYLNSGSRSFTEHAVEMGVATSELGDEEGSMGVDLADYNGDGLPDLWVTNFELEDHSLYRNRGNGSFAHATVAVGLAGRSRIRSGFGTAFIDFDHDGWSDLVVSNGGPLYQTGRSPFLQKPQLFRNQGGKRFQELTHQGGRYFQEVHAGRGLAVSDFDHDGAVDLVISHINEPVTMLQLQRPNPHHITIQLQGVHQDREAIGAKFSYLGPQGRLVHRFVARGAGYLSHSDTRHVLPLPADAAETTVTVTWPGRRTERFTRLKIGEVHALREGLGERVEP